MRLTLEPLAATAADDGVAVNGPDGPAGQLWTRVLAWTCREQLAQLQVLAAEPIALPEHEPSEPLVGALARLAQALHGTGGLLVLRNPGAVFGPDRISFAQGVRLFAVAEPADEACWDAALSLIQPVYGLRGTIACECRSAHPAAVISALAYGLFTCEQGLSLARLEEDRSGVAFAVAGECGEIETAVIVRGGFEAARLRGSAGRWDDRGNEAYVRLAIRDAAGASCWTQPRFVAPRATAPHAGHHGH